ncbi:replication protein RepA [Pseudomonas sp. WS 5051]|uniref:replication protein RepA n=1 Tax=Pseudomonas sp. WS 5051 TaxID=2717482 RepID=UPI0014766B64|nr:replication protein RepA [Pseudomonas sp. WS 5051]NMY54472.1 replication protein RepA [Pseudomonas sp. WS 5051]
MQNIKAYAINTELDGYKTINSVDVMKTAETLRTDYPKVARVINIDGNVIPAIKAALKTASGIASAASGILATNIHNLSKVELAVLIATNDSSDEAFDRAAFEIARDAFTAGDLDGKAQALAGASGRTQEACLKLINAKLSRKKAELVSHLKGLKDEGQAPLDAAEVRDYILSTEGAALLALPTAYGKTSKIIEPVLSEEMARGSKVLVISHRRSINRNIAQLEGIVSYDECDTPDVLQNAQGLKIVVNSLSAHKFKSFIESADVVVIDEASQVIAHVLGGEVKHREAVWNALRFVVKNAKKVILADADINARCVELLADRPSKLFKVAQDHSDITVRTSDSSTVRGLVVEAAKDGKKILVACDGAREAEALGKYIEKKAKRPVHVITAANAKWSEQAEFIANPNSTQHEIVIYSPVITSALSITSNHFESHFGLFGGQIVPSDAIQMLRRDRTATSFTVGLKTPDYRKSEIVDITFKKAMVATEELLRGLTISSEAKYKIREAIAADNAPSAFEALQYDHCSSEAWLKDNISNTLPALLLMQGFGVEVLERDDEMSKSGFVADSQGRKSVKRETAAKLLRSAPAQAEVVHAVKDAGSKDETEYLSVIRARAQEVMGRAQLTSEDAKLWGEGEGELKIKLFRKLYSVSSIRPDDELAVFSQILPAIAEMSLTKGWRADDSSALFDRLNTMRSKVIGLGINMSRANTAKAKQAAVTNVLKCFGLKTRKVDGGKSGDYYIIDQDSIIQMSSYFKVGAPL